MQWDLLPYSSAICSVFGSRCPARSSSLAHPLLPGHVVGRRDDDVVPALENADVDICVKLEKAKRYFTFRYQ